MSRSSRIWSIATSLQSCRRSTATTSWCAASTASRFAEEIGTFLEIYNRALDGTWGFTPLQQGEAKQIADELGHIIAPEFAAFATVNGKTVGAVLALLDYNQIIRKLDGRLFPFGIFRLMRGRRRIDVARAMAVTMVPGYQQSGLGVVLLDRLVEAAKPWGLKGWEFSWVLESNDKSRGSLKRAGTKLTKTWRIYDRPLLRPGSPCRPTALSKVRVRRLVHNRASLKASARRGTTARFHAVDQRVGPPATNPVAAGLSPTSTSTNLRLRRGAYREPTHPGRRRIRDMRSPNWPIVGIDHPGRRRMRGCGFPSARAIAMPSSTYETSSAAAK